MHPFQNLPSRPRQAPPAAPASNPDRSVTPATASGAMHRRANDGWVTLKVASGYAKEEFHLDESYLTATSPYFRHVVNQLVLQGAPLVIEIQKDPAIVGIYVDYKCSGDMPRISSVALGEMGKGDHDVVFERLAACYVLGEEIDDSSFCNAVLTYFCIVMDYGDPSKIFLPGAKAISDIYLGTPTESPIRKFLVDVYVEQGDADMLRDGQGAMDPGFLLDLGLAFCNRRGPATPENVVTPHRAMWARTSQEEVAGGARITKEEELGKMLQTLSM